MLKIYVDNVCFEVTLCWKYNNLTTPSNPPPPPPLSCLFYSSRFGHPLFEAIQFYRFFVLVISRSVFRFPTVFTLLVGTNTKTHTHIHRAHTLTCNWHHWTIHTLVVNSSFWRMESRHRHKHCYHKRHWHHCHHYYTTARQEHGRNFLFSILPVRSTIYVFNSKEENKSWSRLEYIPCNVLSLTSRKKQKQNESKPKIKTQNFTEVVSEVGKVNAVVSNELNPQLSAAPCYTCGCKKMRR